MTWTPNRRFHAVLGGRCMERIPEQAAFLGVLAGIADYTGWSLLTLRVIFIVALIVLTTPAVVFYATAALLMPRRPTSHRLRTHQRELP